LVEEFGILSRVFDRFAEVASGEHPNFQSGIPYSDCELFGQDTCDHKRGNTLPAKFLAEAKKHLVERSVGCISEKVSEPTLLDDFEDLVGWRVDVETGNLGHNVDPAGWTPLNAQLRYGETQANQKQWA